MGLPRATEESEWEYIVLVSDRRERTGTMGFEPESDVLARLPRCSLRSHLAPLAARD